MFIFHWKVVQSQKSKTSKLVTQANTPEESRRIGLTKLSEVGRSDPLIMSMEVFFYLELLMISLNRLFSRVD